MTFHYVCGIIQTIGTSCTKLCRHKPSNLEKGGYSMLRIIMNREQLAWYANRWGINQIRAHDFRVLRSTLVVDCAIPADDDFGVSLFTDESSNRAYVRADWYDDHRVLYEEIDNYADLSYDVICALREGAIRAFLHYNPCVRPSLSLSTLV